MNDERLELVVDNEDVYQNDQSVFYIHPNRLDMVRCLTNNQFNSCTIKNSSIDSLSSMNFSYILRKLKPEATCQVYIYQPITVMQEYDSKQVEANAKLAGFNDFTTQSVDFTDNKNKTFKTLSVSFVKPVKEQNVVEVEVVTVTKKNVKEVKPAKLVVATAPSKNKK
jgi:hypothetical protein